MHTSCEDQTTYSLCQCLLGVSCEQDCFNMYCMKMVKSFAQFGAEEGTPLGPQMGEFLSLDSICQRHNLNVRVLDANSRQITDTLEYGPAAETPIHLLYEPDGVGHYLPLKVSQQAAGAAPYRPLPMTISGSEVHFEWRCKSNRLFPTHQKADALYNSGWASSGDGIPDEYKPSFSATSAWDVVTPVRVHHGWLDTFIVDRCFKVFAEKLHNLASKLPVNAPTTMVWTSSLTHWLYRDARNAFTDTDGVSSPACPANEYSFQQTWSRLMESLTPTSVPQKHQLTPSCVMDYDNIILPFCSGNHFVLVHIRVKERRVRILNSDKRFITPGLEIMQQHICRLMGDIESRAGIAGAPTTAWTLQAAPSHLPQQTDGESCGMFVVGFGAQIVDGSYECSSIKQQHILGLRVMILWMLAQNPPAPVLTRHNTQRQQGVPHTIIAIDDEDNTTC